MNTDDVVIWFDEGGALQVTEDGRAEAMEAAFGVVPGLIDLVRHVGLSGSDDAPMTVAACAGSTLATRWRCRA